jgi:hypothetical protein
MFRCSKACNEYMLKREKEARSEARLVKKQTREALKQVDDDHTEFD